MSLTMFSFANLHILHWIVTVLLPAVLLIASLVYLLFNRSCLRRILRPLDKLTAELEKLERRDIANIDHVERLIKNVDAQLLGNNFAQIKKDAQTLYEGRWLPDPEQYFNQERLLPQYQANSLSLRPAARILALGIIGGLISVLLQAQIAIPSWLHPATMSLPPLLIGLACALILSAEAMRANRLISQSLHSFYISLGKKVPVFNDQAGLALVIDRFLDYDRRMTQALSEFNATASRLAESDMAEGIRHSVEQVLLDSVAPSLNLATAALSELAEELEKRQAQGMQELAAQFATALSADIAGHMRPVNKEISQMSALMADVKNYIEYAMRSLETVRAESTNLLQDTRQALQTMADARTALTDDFARADEKLEILTRATASLAEIQKGNEKGLTDSLHNLSSQLQKHSEEISIMVNKAISDAEKGRQLSEKQNIFAENYIESLQEQVNKLNTGLQDNIEKMLSRISSESTGMTEQAAALSQQMNRLNDTLAHSLTEFSHESTKYVQNTLTDFDKNLAELVRRMTQATTEIRDAVDALPAVLSQPPKFES